MRAFVLIRPEPFYRRSAFVSGLKAAGHEVVDGPPKHLDADTLLLIWSRYGEGDALATRVEAAGGVVICAENGFIGRGGSTPKWSVHPHGPKPGDFYALAIGGHNGSGQTPEGDGSRWAALGIPLKPLRREGGHVLICPSRRFGRPGLTMAANWAEVTAGRLEASTGREVRVRAHPGNNEPPRPLQADLEGAWCVIIWYASVGIHALVAGVPVIAECSRWIAKSAALSSLRQVEVLDDSEHEREVWERLRLRALQKMAHAQFTCREIESGMPFERLLATCPEMG